MLVTMLATIILVTVLFAAMAIGVIMGRKPVQGSCGGMGAAGLGGDCGGCGRKADQPCPRKAAREAAEREAAATHAGDPRH